MPRKILRPIGFGSIHQWVGAALSLADDSDVTALQSNATGQVFLVAFEPLPADAVVVNRIDLYFRAQGSLSVQGRESSFAPRVDLGASSLELVAVVPGETMTTFESLAIGRPGGGAYSVADTNAVTVGAHTIRADVNSPLVMPTMWLDVDYGNDPSGILISDAVFDMSQRADLPIDVMAIRRADAVFTLTRRADALFKEGD